MTDYTELKRLAEAATPGPWECREAEGSAAICHEHGWVADDFSEQTLIDTRYMAAANPAAVLALIAENEKLQNKWVSFANLCAQATEAHDNLLGENVQLKAKNERLNTRLTAEQKWFDDEYDQLKAEVEALRKDAERYRWLRDGAGYCDTRDIPGMAPARMDAFIDAAKLMGANDQSYRAI